MKSIRHWSGPKSTRIVFDLTHNNAYRAKFLTNLGRVQIYLPGVKVLRSRMQHAIGDGLIDKATAENYGKKSSMVIVTFSAPVTYNLFKLLNPPRLVMDVYPKEEKKVVIKPVMPPKEEKSASSEPPTNITDSNQPVPLARQLGLKIGRIVLDPGHGGSHTGARGRGGLLEKHVTLDIALKCQQILQDSGYTVLLTRSQDQHVPLEERTAFANQNQADVFISIHVNAHRKRDRRGIETFYLALASDSEAQETAALENAVAASQMHELESILQRLTRFSYRLASRDLANLVQKSLVHATAAEDRGVKTAPFYVLVGAEMPAILVECGFISNSEEEHLLAQEEYRMRLAQALATAIMEYNGNADVAEGVQ